MNQPPLFEFNDPAGSSSPVIHLALANGFPALTYRPLLEPLTRRYRVLSLPPRALWPGGTTPADAPSWRVMADDLLAGLRAHHLTDVIAIGHSMGGVASLLAVLAEPDRFRALILLDPTILMPGTLRLIRFLYLLGLPDYFPLARRALRRRRDFSSVEAAYTYFRNKALFASWPDETIRLYAQSITRPAENGRGVTLAWTPEWEAHYYRTIYTESWRAVPRLRALMPRLPVLAIRGGATDTFTRLAAGRMQRILPEMTLVEIAGHGHFFPHSAPVETQQVIAGWLAKHGL